MSGPQGPDPTQPWSGQPAPGQDQPSGDPTAAGQNPWQPPASGSEQPQAGAEGQQQWQPPAYGQQPYPPYQQPGQPAYPPPQPTEYNPAAYGQPGQPGQFGQYGQPPGQFGAPPYGQQPGQFGQQPGQYGQFPPYDAARAEGSGPKSKMLLGVLGGVLGLVVIAVLVLGLWKPGFLITTKLDVNAAQTGVQQILTDETNGYGAKNVRDVVCNDGESPTVKKDTSFTCEVSIDGTKRRVTVTFLDDDGTYQVGRPQ
ncbi:DUF4333 domain-containing protein [Mycolicibacterium thermoresistibile]